MSTEAYHNRVLPVRPKLYRLALRLLGNMADAEDVVQEVLLKMWAGRDELPGIANAEAWCMRLTRNLSLDRLKSQAYKVQQQAVDVDTAPELPQEQESNVADLAQLARQLMDTLPEDQRLVMHLRDVEGYSYQDIADTLEWELSKVKVYLHRARKQIQKQLLANPLAHGY